LLSLSILNKLSSITPRVSSKKFLTYLAHSLLSNILRSHAFNKMLPWVSHPAKFRVDSNKVYSISSMEPQFKYIEMMTCRLYRKEDTTHYFLPWVPLIHTIAEGCSFDWAKLLSDSLTNQINEYQMQKASGKAASFFMSVYIMDVVCFMTPFPIMSWI